jgi:hypothetical protein
MLLPWLLLQTVEELLHAAGLTGAERVAAPSWHYAADPEAAPAAAPAADGTLALRDALAYCYDLRSPKTEPLLQLLQQAVGASKAAPAVAAAANGVRASIEMVADATAVAGNGKLLPPLSPTDTNQAADAAKQQQAQSPAKPATTAAAAAGGKEGRSGARGLQQQQQLEQLSSSKEVLQEYLAPRHVADVLREFGCTQLTSQQVRRVCSSGSCGCTACSGGLSPDMPCILAAHCCEHSMHGGCPTHGTRPMPKGVWPRQGTAVAGWDVVCHKQ